MVLSTLTFLLLALLVTAVFLLSRPPSSPLHEHLKQDAAELLKTVEDLSTQSTIRKCSARAADAIDGILSRHFLGVRLTVSPVIAAATIRGALALSALPILAALLVVGVLAGLLRRHLLRDDFGFHSATFSYVGKMLTAFSVAAYAFTAVSPIGPGLWCLYLFSLTGSLGTGLYFGNLPPRL